MGVGDSENPVLGGILVPRQERFDKGTLSWIANHDRHCFVAARLAISVSYPTGSSTTTGISRAPAFTW
jgi:hypothetical protein